MTAAARVLAEIDRRQDELVDLAATLVGFDTTVRGEADEPARDEADLQAYLADRLRAAGASVDLWTPAPGDLPRSAQTPEGLGFEGRPQLIARFAGTGGGRSLVFNGHVDVVSAEPRKDWSSDPFRADLRDGRLYGRGACDMKGGVAAMVLAAEVIAGLGLRLPGDLLVSTATDEEWNGAGTLAAVAYGLRADAGIVPEPTDLGVVSANRGILGGAVTVAGRPGHAEYPPGDWRQGGAVNAIEKMMPVLTALQRLREDWARRPELTHPLLPVPSIVPTMIKGGEWWVSYPASCEVSLDVTFLPVQADGEGYASRVRAEIEAAVLAAVAADPWLAAHPPRFAWETELSPAEVPADHRLVHTLQSAAARLGRPAAVTGDASWSDAGTLTRLGGTPSVCLGPTATRPDGSALLHTVDEYVEVADLLATAKVLALSALDLTAAPAAARAA